MEFILNISDLNKETILIAGGKGASLGEMINSNNPVPGGFVILTNAFERFLEETDINVLIDAILDKVNVNAIHTIEEASEEIQGVINNSIMPKDIETLITKQFYELKSKYVAVRSSATSEDSTGAAWAGQLDSFLNTTKENLLINVKNCWASLFTPRAIAYRFEKKLHTHKISVAVVVQKMIQSEKSGIAFSVHPITQDPNQLIIEAGYGLGEAIVSGSVTPDSYVVDKETLTIIDINVNEQKKELVKKGNQNVWQELGDKGKQQVLNEKEIKDLSKLIIKIENHYGFPCDIEFAQKQENFYILQSRPITTLKKLFK
jgi:pyruvate, water dikinase